MTRRLFVCHATADIEATSELVDALENALNFGTGTLWTSGLPGYSAEPNDMPALGAALAGSDVVLALVTLNSVVDAQFHFQLGAAWALGAHTVLFMLDSAAEAKLPNALSQATQLRGHEKPQWAELIGELSVRLSLVPRPGGASTAPSLTPSYPPGTLSAAVPPPLPAAEPAVPPPLPAAEPALPPPLPAAIPDLPSVLVAAAPVSDPDVPTTPIVVLSVPEVSAPQPIAADPRLQPTASAPVRPAPSTSSDDEPSYLDELRAIGRATARPRSPDRTPPRYSYIDELRVVDQEDTVPELEEITEEEPETGEQLKVPLQPEAAVVLVEEAELATIEQVGDSDTFTRLPTCEMALEAGRAVSDCVFNRDEIDDLSAELDEPLGRLVESLGASWVELRGEQDLDTWVAVTDHLLETLPEEVRKLEEWYRVGFELAILHNLAGQLVLDGSDPIAEQHWRGALERFLMRAERAEIGYENLGRVLGLLENLVGPSHERDLSNIPRSLEELRRYAAGADIHTAA